MKNLRRLLFLLPLLFLAGCETINTTRDYDLNAKFSDYKTYSWAPEPNTQSFVSPVTTEAIHAAVDKGLTERGFTLAKGNAKPDFYVVYHVTAAQKAEERHYTDWGYGTAYRSGYGYYSGWPGAPKTYTVLEQYKVGALVLDFVELRRQQLVWRGVASSVISDKPAANAEKAKEAVQLLLSKFPPPPTPPKP